MAIANRTILGRPCLRRNAEESILMKQFIARCIALLLLFQATGLVAQEVPAVHMANGIKIGEVTSTSAIIWTRLTENPERNVDGKPFPKNENKARRSLQFDDLGSMLDSAPGTAGQVCLYYWEEGTDDRKASGWVSVDVDRDFTHQFKLKDLKPGTRYVFSVKGRPEGGDGPTSEVQGGFATAPDPSTAARIQFAVTTCTDYPRRDTPEGHKIYPQMEKLGIDFFVHTGDIEYYDCLLYTSPSPRDLSTSRMPSSA